jgi:hypothetical protein
LFSNSRRWRRTIVVGTIALAAGAAAAVYAFRHQVPEDPATRKMVGSYDGIVGVAQPADPASLPFATAAPGEHSLAPMIRWAKSLRSDLDSIQDYTATLIKRERVGKRVLGPEHMALKLRQKPFSVYLRFLSPADVRGREVIYVAGRNDGKFQVHLTGFQQLLGTVALKPDDPLALTDNRHPITETGVQNLVDRLIEVGEQDMKHGDCEVRVTRVPVQGHEAICIEVDHPQRQPYFLYHRARIYIDEARKLPVRFEAYDWPDATGQPQLLEEYTYLDLKLNVGLTDLDFDTENPAYGYSRTAAPSPAKPAAGKK